MRFNMNRHLISIMMDSNVFECTVVQANKDIRKESRILDVNATVKNITEASTTRNSTIVQANSTIECQQKNNL